MRTVIKRDVNSGHEESLSKLIDAVHNSYSGLRDKDLAQYGRSITDRDILCTISEMFKTCLDLILSSKIVILLLTSFIKFITANCFDLIFCLVSWLKSIENNGLLVSTGSLASPRVAQNLFKTIDSRGLKKL
jgi:hypothetical protein